MSAPTDYIAYWKLEDDADDETGNYNGTGTDVTFTDGLSARFNGTTSNIDCNFSFPVNRTNYSIFGFIKLDSDSNIYSSLLANSYYSGGTDARGINLGACYNNLYPYIRLQNDTNNYKIESDTEITKDGTWYHLGFVKSGDNVKLYLDKIEVGEETSATGLDNYQRDYTIGVYTDDDPLLLYFAKGNIANIRIYDYALSTINISDIYDEDYPTTIKASATVSINSTAYATKYPGATATTTVTATASPTRYPKATASVSINASASYQISANATVAITALANPISASASTSIAATGTGKILWADIEMFTFVQTIQQPNYNRFIFVQSIEQVPETIMIKRVNV